MYCKVSQLCDLLVETQPTLSLPGEQVIPYMYSKWLFYTFGRNSALDYIILLYNKVMCCNHYQNHLVLITKPVSLFEDDLRGSLAVHAEVSIRQLDNCAHGFPDRVEGVDFIKLLLRDLVSYWLVIPLQVQYQSQQAAFCLVAHLLRQTAFLIWGLERGRGRDFRMFTSILIFAAIQWNMFLLSTCGYFALNFSLQAF